MFFTGRIKQIPNLSEYLDQAVRDRPRTSLDFPWALAGLGFAAGAITWAVATIFGQEPASIAVFASALGMWWIGAGSYWVWERSNAKPSSEETAQQRLRLEAYQIARRLHASKDKRRLHRDVSEGVLSLLEECARSWSRAREALASPFWSHPELPLHWQSIRDQSLIAVNQAMNEVLVILSNAVPEEPGKWRLDEVVEEVLGRKVFPGEESDDRMPLTFEPARDLAEKLKLLASEIESATRDVAKDEAIAAQFSSGSALDLCLGELKSIQRAEDELRQEFEQT